MSLLIERQTELIPGYRLIERIGGGGFGEVWKAEAPGGLVKAIKIVHGDIETLDVDGQHRAKQELKSLQRVQSVRHPYLLSIERYDIIDGRLLIVTELADSNLVDRFKECQSHGLPGIPRSDLLRFMCEAAEVLDLMNESYQLQHLDIKPQNIFLIHDHVKVGDFGLVKDLEGIRSVITSGVTPHYAAPETFEGLVSRYCDQYSLAIVYQELLTGQRPFSGPSVQQLVLQHLQASPNLSLLPQWDRAAVAKALAKNPEDRHASCAAFVSELQAAAEAFDRAQQSVPTSRPSKVYSVPPIPAETHGSAPTATWPQTPPTVMRLRAQEEAPAPPADAFPKKSTPQEVAGEGVLVPAVIIAAGGVALEVVRQFRRALGERFGGPRALPHIRTVFIDTDPETLAAAVQASGGASLKADDIVPTRLNRASHYLKPRQSGRSLIEGWFDQQMLYRIPRNGETAGIRALGRLALADHYRILTEKLDTVLEAVLRPEALQRAEQETKLGIRGNRPRVYVIAGLGGGTAGGMFLDLAYAARYRLAHLGYEKADVNGLLLLPPGDSQTGAASDPAAANTVAALTELQYFTRPDTTYICNFDERGKPYVESGPPFRQIVAAPSDAAGIWQMVEFLTHQLMSPLGKHVDERRTTLQDATSAQRSRYVSVFGLSRISWPRRAILVRTARRVCQTLLKRWLRADATPIRPRVQKLVHEQWTNQRFGGEHLLERLKSAAAEAVGQPPDSLFDALADSFAPQGRQAGTGYDLLSRLEELVGRPDRAGGLLDDALLSTADGLAKEWGSRLSQLAIRPIEQPDFRLAGAEEAINQLDAFLQQTLKQYTPAFDKLVSESNRLHQRIHALLAGDAAGGSAGPASQRSKRAASVMIDLIRASRDYPKIRYQALCVQQVIAICTALRGFLADERAQVGFCRQRLEELLNQEGEEERELGSAGGEYLLPPQCRSLDDAVDRLFARVSEKDIDSLDHQVQQVIQTQFTALSQLCLTATNLPTNLEPAMLNVALRLLAARVEDANVVDMFLTRCRDSASASRTVAAAMPVLTFPMTPTNERAEGQGTKELPSGTEICVLAMPAGKSGDQLQSLIGATVLPNQLTVCPSQDDIVFYREQPFFALADLPHMKPAARAAYDQAVRLNHFTLHTRADIEEWKGRNLEPKPKT